MKIHWLLLLLISSLAVAETGYRKVNPDGSVEFSDQPIPGAEALELREAPTIEFVPSQTVSGPVSGKGAASSTAGTLANYTATITTPQQDETLWFQEGGVTVVVTINPPLQEQDSIRVRLDGQVVAEGKSTSLQIPQVYRGTHQLVAEVVSNDQILATSPVITFHLRQHSQLLKQKQPTESQQY